MNGNLAWLTVQELLLEKAWRRGIPGSALRCSSPFPAAAWGCAAQGNPERAGQKQDPMLVLNAGLNNKERGFLFFGTWQPLRTCFEVHVSHQEAVGCLSEQLW